MIKSKQIGFLLFMVFIAGILFPVFSEAQNFPPYQKYEGPLKPGMEITRENFDQYSFELKKLLMPSKFQWYAMGITEGLVTMPIGEARQCSLSKGQINATLKYKGTARISANNQLENWTAGVPFPEPKNSLELAWDANPTIYRAGHSDDCVQPSAFALYRGTRYEKRFVWNLYNRQCRGRMDIPPLGDLPSFTNGGISQKESLLVFEPHEVRGFIQLRIRYWAVDKPDSCYGYIPTIRRIRRLTGSDLTDPLLGSDCVPDDFEAWRQKLDDKMEFRILECRDFLVPRTYIGSKNKPPYDYRKHGPCVQAISEFRTLWVMEVTLKDPDYVYSKRLFYINATPFDEKGDFLIYWGENFDLKGRLWRAGGFAVHYDNGEGFRTLNNWIYMNVRSNHYSMMDNFKPCYDPPEHFHKVLPLKEDQAFSIKGLLRRAR